MYPEGFHPIDTRRSPSWDGKAKRFTRTERPVRYIMIDFGLSIQVRNKNTNVVYPARGGDRSAPEHRPELLGTLQNPFPTDVYYLGNLIKEEFMKVSDNRLPSIPSNKRMTGIHGFEFYDRARGRHGQGCPC